MQGKYQTETIRDPFPHQVAFGARLRGLREQRRIGLLSFARLVGVSKPTVWKWESGVVRPRQRSIEAVASILGVSERELMFGRGDGQEAKPSLIHASSQRLSEVISACKEQIADAAGTAADNIAITIQI